MSQADPVRVLVVGDPYMPAGIFTHALAGAALDVTQRRPAGDRHPLLGLANVIITPHIGGATHEALRRGAEMAAGAVAQLVAGEIPGHMVNPEIAARKEAAS